MVDISSVPIFGCRFSTLVTTHGIVARLIQHTVVSDLCCLNDRQSFRSRIPPSQFRYVLHPYLFYRLVRLSVIISKIIYLVLIFLCCLLVLSLIHFNSCVFFVDDVFNIDIFLFGYTVYLHLPFVCLRFPFISSFNFGSEANTPPEWDMFSTERFFFR